MLHDVLGEITHEGDSGDGLARIRYGPRQINVRVIPDDQPFETTLRLAAEVVARLDELDQHAKRIAVTELRDAYNNGWNEYDEAQEDGSLKTVSNSQLSEEEFEKKLSLYAINVTGDQMVHFFYEDEGMFWGHSVVVCSLQGIDFSEARAELFG